MWIDVTKEEAAGRQVDAAIDALRKGDYDIAITLAGAAEGMFSDRRRSDMWSMFLSHPSAAKFPKNILIAFLNAERDWLKHPSTGMPSSLRISASDAAYIIARAMTKLSGWSDKMKAAKPLIEEIISSEPDLP